MKAGKFIAFEGVDASGKSTNVKLLEAHLVSRGYKVWTTREPGGSVLAEKIRHLIFDNSMTGLTELLLMFASRADHIEKTIRPALAAGHVVICDRYVGSSIAYQGFGRDLLEQALMLEQMVAGVLVPDYTLFFDVPLEESIRRLEGRSEGNNRLDHETIEFKKKVFEGYQYFSKHTKQNLVRIDALPEPETVQASVLSWANTVFPTLE